LEQHFPVNNDEFLETDVDYSSVHEDIKEAE
ncbi:acetolactate decarboxylase, partial [Staphylococcus equorum]